MDELPPAVIGKTPDDFPDSQALRRGDMLYFGGTSWRIVNVVAQPTPTVTPGYPRLFLQVELQPVEGTHADRTGSPALL